MKKTLKIVAIPCLVMLVAVIIALIFSDGIKYEVAVHGQMEKSASFEAILIRDEVTVEIEKKGVLESLVDDREMVRKNKHVASVFESEINEEDKSNLERIKYRIAEIEKLKEQMGSSEVSAYHLERAMDSATEKISEAMLIGDMSAFLTARDEINLLNDRKNALENGEEYTDSVLKSLNEEKQKIERKLGGSKQDIFAPEAGIYTTSTDGFEAVLTPDAIGEMTPYDYESINKMHKENKAPKSKKAVCKIIKGTSWSVAFVATQKEIAKLKEGSSVYVRAEGRDGDSKASISYISTPVNGNYLVIATSQESASWAMEERFAKIDLVRDKFSGLRVPLDALRVKDGKTGVYTALDGIVHFKEVKVLCKDSSYAIVEENNSAKGTLLLYDEIIVSSRKKLKEGDRIS